MILFQLFQAPRCPPRFDQAGVPGAGDLGQGDEGLGHRRRLGQPRGVFARVGLARRRVRMTPGSIRFTRSAVRRVSAAYAMTSASSAALLAA